MSFRLFRVLFAALVSGAATAAAAPLPITPPDLVFAETDGVVAVEAEHFSAQTISGPRCFWIQATTDPAASAPTPDPDPSHAATASGGAYLELLPDTRATRDDPLVKGENFSDAPGRIATVSYRVRFVHPGRYYFWARTFSTGSEDNGMHVGLDDTWPASGQRWQTVQKGSWQWDCRQRTPEVHVGVPLQLFLDIPQAGDHTIQLSMREDGFEIDKWVLTRDPAYVPTAVGPTPAVAHGTLPAPFPVAIATATPPAPATDVTLSAADLFLEGTDYYLDRGTWAAVNPARHRSAALITTVPAGNARYAVALHVVGESAGPSTYDVLIGGRSLGAFTAPRSQLPLEEGPAFIHTWPAVSVNEGEALEIRATVGSADGRDYSRARWSRLVFTPLESDPGKSGAAHPPAPLTPARTPTPDARRPFGDGTITVTGELKQWHKVTVELAGPFAAESDLRPNPFTDYAYNVTFTHASGTPSYTVPGYFAADGDAADTGATAGTVWRAHLAPDQPGAWTYTVSFLAGPNAATYHGGRPLAPYDGLTGTFTIAPTDKTAPDFRARGRLTYTGERYLRFAGDGTRFIKAGADAPETFLAYTGFDNTIALKPNVPLKTWAPHLADWRPGDPTWRGGEGKGIIGALNYLAAKGANAFSFLTYNAAGDGDNIWPFVERDDKLHYDVSKLAQWEIVFAHAQQLGLYLHFKLQENEQDDHRAGARGNPKQIPEAMDAGETGPERRLYFRELIARFGHHLALNWNFGEENTQSYAEQVAMFDYVAALDPYQHHRVIHTFPAQQDRVYTALLGQHSNLTGASAQNPWDKAHERTLQWVEASAAAGRPWVVANDEQNPAGMGVPPDPGYDGFDGRATSDDGRSTYDLNDIRKYTLWGNLMAGGAGVEYYFGYRLPQNDLNCEDFRSRDRSWDYCRLAIQFFADLDLDLARLQPADARVGTVPGANGNWCLAAPGERYVVYLPAGGTATLDLRDAPGAFSVEWFNPRDGTRTAASPVQGGASVQLGPAPADPGEDWTVVLRR